MKDYLLPIIALVGGIVSLFIDSKDTKKRWLFVTGLTITAIVTVVFNVQDSRTKQTERLDAVAAESKRADDLKTALDALIAKVDDTPAKVARLVIQGFLPEAAKRATPQEFEAAFQADRKYASIVNAGARFPDVSVEYYPKGQDSAAVKRAIETLGLKVHIATPRNETSTNTIWAGPSVPDDALRFVAVTLLRAGAKISTVNRIPNPTGTRTRLIQIGSDPGFDGRPSLTLDAIGNLKSAYLK